MAIFDDLLNQAKAAEQTLKATLAGFTAEKQPELSDLGRKQFQDRAKDLYARTIADLKRRYQMALEAESAKTAKALEAARVADVERRRALLGDAAMLRIYERRLGMMDGDGLRQALAEAAPGYEAALIRELGGVILSERLRDGGDVATHRAAQEFAQPATPELSELRNRQRDLAVAAQRESRLDPISWKNDRAERLGVKAELMEMPA
jgi:hypothetical protein